MKTTSKTAIVLLALGASAWMVTAQDGNGPPPRGERPQREGPAGPGGPGQLGERGQPGEPGGPGRDGQRPPPPPLMAALDVNHDGVIDEEEIANASEALKKLDKNGDGKLTLDELRPPRPEGDFRAGGPAGRRGPDDRRGPEGRRPGGFDGPRGPGGEGDRPLPPPGGPREDGPLPPPRDN